ncbi:MAG TPA: hypothetical protein VD833_10975 [Vicinamibacterales bacterium]|nr:hypothetical protein [Vicinamibacterales bacterium]
MVTNYPQRLSAATQVGVERRPQGGIAARVLGSLGQFFCGLRGHEAVLHFEGNRVMMRCTTCGHDTPGWEISSRGPRRRFEGDARRHVLAPKRLVLKKTA